MSPVPGLLARLSQEGIFLAVEGRHLAVSPAAKVTPELRGEILSHRRDLLNLFRDPPAWPPPRGESGLLADPDAVLRAIGRPVSLRDGRQGTLRAVLYETRSGLTRCRVDFAGGESLVLCAEQVFPLSETAAARGESA